ncbi:MAG: hypothetical protein DHS20C18_10540 [Saprospiraceae bacterium]|nr:MAG: hypothetical protein DHS20C18_10540 [Saprospiraceae bacterium]
MGMALHAQKNLHQIGVHFAVSNLTNINALQSANNPITGIFQVSPGIDYHHYLCDRVALFTALDFTVFKEKYQNDQLRWPSEFDGMGGWVPDSKLPHQAEINISYYFLDWQVGAKWILAEQRFGYFIMPYLESNFFIDRQFQTKYIYDDGHAESASSSKDTENSNTFRKVNLSVGLGVGLDYHLAPCLSLYFMPQIEYMLFNAIENEQGRFLNYGARLGLWYDF